MRFVDDHYRLQPVNAAHEFNIPVQLPLGIAAVKLGLTPELLQQALV